jgi:thiamine-monophosphate kinase
LKVRTLQDIGEFELIKKIASHIPSPHSKGVIGIGDDCAVIPMSDTDTLLVTCDTLIEEIHFLKNKISPEDLGYKSLAVNVSDIAAMGGEPKWAFLSLSLPKYTEVDWVERFMEGFQGLAEKYNILLLGGDTTASPEHIVITITLLGSQKKKFIKRRSHVVPGDVIVATGTLGESACALKYILADRDRDNDEELVNVLLRRHLLPIPHLLEGAWLAKLNEVHSLIDVSDGLVSDLTRLASESKVGIDLYVEHIPLAPELIAVCDANKWDPVEFALSGGEDYVLLAAIQNSDYAKIAREFELTFGRPLVSVAKATHHHMGVQSLLHGKKYYPKSKGFDHFKRESAI